MSTLWLAVLVSSIMLALVIVSCGETSPESISEFQQIISRPETGLIKHYKLGSVDMALQYLPPEFLAMKDATADNEMFRYEEYLDYYDESSTFIFRMDSDELSEDTVDPHAVTPEQGTDESNSIGSDMRDSFVMELHGKSIKPVLCRLESTIDIVPVRTVIVVFPGNIRQLVDSDESLTVTFKDGIYGTGVSRYTYRASDILNAPIPQI